MIRVTCERGSPQQFETPHAFVTWLYARDDQGMLIARYESDAELIAVLFEMGEAGGAKTKAHQLANAPFVELWSHDHQAAAEGWAVLLVRKAIPLKQTAIPSAEQVRLGERSAGGPLDPGGRPGPRLVR